MLSSAQNKMQLQINRTVFAGFVLLVTVWLTVEETESILMANEWF